MRRSRVLGVVALLSLVPEVATAQPQQLSYGASQSAASEAVLPGRLEVVCTLIGSQTTAGENDENVFEYQTRLYEAAGVTSTDTHVVRARKVRDLWRKYLRAFTCSNSGFDVPKGSLLKYAVAQGFDTFITDATGNWQLELNHVDDSDGRTTLDYIYDEQNRRKHHASPAQNQKLSIYYKQFRNAGAKHRVEIDGVDCRVSISSLEAIRRRLCWR